MKYSINNYTSAFFQTIKKYSQDEVIMGLVKLLKKTGDIKHSKKIIKSIHKELVNKNGGKWVNVEIARESTSVQKLRDKFSEADHVDFKVNPELIAGIRVTLNDEEELNNSLQNKLNKLFR